MNSYCCLCILIVGYVFLFFVHEFLSLSMYTYCCPCILIVVYVFLLFVHVFLLLSIYILIVVYVFLDAATLTEVSPCYFLSCKANARV